MTRKASEDELFYTLFHQSLDALAVLDVESQKFVLFNDNVLKLYGYSRKEFSVITPMELTLEFEDENILRYKQKQILEQGWDIFYTMHRAKDGEVMNILVKSKRIFFENKAMLLISLHHIHGQTNEMDHYDSTGPIVRLNNFRWDFRNRELYYVNRKIRLTKNETKLISLLLKYRSRYYTSQELCERLEMEDENLTGNNVVQLISRLKRKTQKAGAKFFFIENLYGLGYRIK